ncbi:MAG: hypothetical protein Q8Q24_00955 [bacterium]|nr:hypothetical protein [bacterium]
MKQAERLCNGNGILDDETEALIALANLTKDSKDIEEAKQFAAKIKDESGDKAKALIAIASGTKEIKDFEEAVEATSIINNGDNDHLKAMVLLDIAKALSQIMN